MTSHDNPGSDDKDSTNFGVDSQNEWKCWVHNDGVGAFQLVAVLEGIRDCENAAGVMQDPEDRYKSVW